MTNSYDQATENLQLVLDVAYARWQEGGDLEGASMEDWFNNLPEIEQLGVALGKFNQQVTNGGFNQWWGNGYAEVMWDRLVGAVSGMKEMGLSTATKVDNLLERFYAAIGGELDNDRWERSFDHLESCDCDEDDLEDRGCTCGHEDDKDEYEAIMDDVGKLDNRFYEFDELFLLEATAYIMTLLNRKAKAA